jgi:endonuclease/exonuclease/phosphatase family metal-dependent hydrolase
MQTILRYALAHSVTAALLVGAASAQTTVSISDPIVHVDDARIQGGSMANTVFDGEKLATKIHPTNAAYTRRSVLKFDTHNTVPAGATVSSATLVLTISKADAESRRLGVYRLSQTFDEDYASWTVRKSGSKWTTQGGDLAEKFAELSVGSTVGSKVSFDLTKLVQGVVKGTYGSSRYTRIALVDLGSGSNTSYKEFHNSESSDTSVRPVLKVVYGGSAPPPDDPEPEPEPAPAPTGSTIKVLHWNIHRGYATDGAYNLSTIGSWLAKINPHVISLNEVHYDTSYTDDNQPALLKQMLESKTGRTWYSYFRTTAGSTKGHGNLILSRYPISASGYCQLDSARVAAQATVAVNGRNVNFYSTHLDSADSGTKRIAEVKALLSCLGNDAEQKIVAGDFNAQASSTEINLMKDLYVDGWAKADANGDAYSYPGNTRWGATRNSRIDYVFVSEKAGYTVIRKAEVLDTRDSSGDMPSDHKPLVLTLEIK